MWPEPGYPEPTYLMGLDLAQGGADWTAVAVLMRQEGVFGEPASYACIHLERWRDRRTARIPERVLAIEREVANQHRRFLLAYDLAHGRGLSPAGGPFVAPEAIIRLVVDQTGVGPFGLDPLRQAGFWPLGVVIHGGDAVSHPDASTYRVPKRDLAGAVNTLLQSGRLRINATLDDAAILQAELENFRARISLAGHDSYGAGAVEAWRSGSHDDLVLAVGIACWLGEAEPPPRLDPTIVAAWADLPGGGWSA
jgi:hypothetical protein